jgi:hypothetical protein
MRILPSLLVLPVQRFIIGLYLFLFPVVVVSIGLVVEMVFVYSFPGMAKAALSPAHIMLHYILLVPTITGLYLKFGINGLYMSILPGTALFFLALIITTTQKMLSVPFLEISFGINSVIACLSLIYIYWFFSRTQKVARFDLEGIAKGFE